MERPLSSVWRIVAGAIISATVLPVSLVLLISNPPGSVETRGGVDLKDFAPILTAIIGAVCGPLNIYLAWRADRRNAREMDLKLKKLEQELEVMKLQTGVPTDKAKSKDRQS